MESEYPPLPSRRVTIQRPSRPNQAAADHQPSRQNTTNNNAAISTSSSVDRFRGMEVAPNGSKTMYKILSRDGDAVLEYVDTATTRYRWQVSSDSLRRNSPFFAALLDPNKFAEGRLFQEKAVRVKQQQQQQSSAEHISGQVPTEGLPLVSLNVTRLTGKHRIEILELFLKVVQSSDGDEYQNARLAEELSHQPISVVAGVLEIADLFSSSNIIHDALKRAGYVPSLKGKVSLLAFSSSLLKLSEDRIRQILYVALVLENQAVFQVLSHTLVLLGSTNWTDGLGVGKHGSHRWAYFPNGIEEELYYRRQCILNTITDLQAHFLRVYGALEDDTERERSLSKTNMPPTAVVSNTRPIQCRWGFSNSRACDSYHLGEMVRFFSLRSKTIFLGSTLIDPQTEVEGEEEEEEEEEGEEDEEEELDENSISATGIASTDIPSITALLRQIPDYQIDPNHTGCGIRRRLLPALDCIDGFIGHRRAPVGLKEIRCWKRDDYHRHNNNPDSWKDRGRPLVETVDIHSSKIVGVRTGRQKAVEKNKSSSAVGSNNKPGAIEPISSLRGSLEAEARILFTARKRSWES